MGMRIKIKKTKKHTAYFSWYVCECSCCPNFYGCI